MASSTSTSRAPGMSYSGGASTGGGGGSGNGKSFFEQQREVLLGEIAVSFEHVLANINKLNRSLEGVIAVGNEFSSVEALWSQFESVMAKDVEGEGEQDGNEVEGDANGGEMDVDEGRGEDDGESRRDGDGYERVGNDGERDGRS